MTSRMGARAAGPWLPGVAIALLLAVATGALFWATGRPPATPQSTPTTAAGSAAPSASRAPTAAPTAAPSATADASLDLAAIERDIAAIEREVREIRGLSAPRRVPTRLLREDEFVAELRDAFTKANPEARLSAEQELYERLGFLPADADLRELVLKQLGAGVAGYYRPDRKDMTVIKRTGGYGPLERQVIAHEYTHALQDQHYDLNALGLADISNADRALALRALVEGDAVLVQTKWGEAHQSPADLADVLRATDLQEQAKLASGVPPVLLRQSAFPYLDGLFFVAGLETSGGWAAVNAAFAKPPVSTEQILHPEKYRAGEAPRPVALPSIAKALGAGWSESVADTMGEVNIQVWAAQQTGPTASRRAAAGWGGDRVASYDGPNGAWAVVWETRWDSATDATEFGAAAETVLGPFTSPNDVVVDLRGDRVRVVVGSTDRVVRTLAGATP